jgi:PAS domain S-box-containing protein
MPHSLPEEIRVLLVDDDEDDFLLTSDYLREIPQKRVRVDWASSYSDALRQIQELRHDIYFFDFLLGARTGLDLIQEAIRLGCEAPIVLLTGKGDRQVDEDAMRLGAVDYLVKSELNPESLERTMRYALDRAANLKILKESEARYRNLFEQSQDAVFIANERGHLLFVNEATTRLTNYSREELFQATFFDFFEDAATVQRLHQTLMATGEVRNFESTLKAKGGERRYGLVSATMHAGSADQRYIQAIVHDITARKRAEQEAMRFEKLAATGRLVRTLAHEVRNPLTNINLSIEQLETELQDEDLTFYLDVIRRNSQRINGLITELLNSSKPTPMSMDRHSIHQLLDDTLELARDRINLKGIRMEKSYCDDCFLLLDTKQVGIAFTNIIVNAIEAIDRPDGWLYVGTDMKEGACVVAIQDNGCGIPPENLERLFEPYFTSKNNGIGLGLAATLNILQSHRATIEVESVVGEGTTFRISFPMIQENGVLIVSPTPASESSSQSE